MLSEMQNHNGLKAVGNKHTQAGTGREHERAGGEC